MLLAQQQATETILYGGGTAAVLLLIREVAPLLFRYLSGRDALLDRRRSDILNRLDQCEEDRRTLHDELGGLRQQVDTLSRELREIGEYTVVATIISDATGTITQWSHGAEILFKYTREEAVGQDVAMLIPLREHMAHGEAFKKAVETQQLSEGKVIALRDSYAVRHDGLEIPVNIELSVVHVDPIRFGATIRKRMP